MVRTALNAGASWWRRRGRELPLAGHDAMAPRDADDGLDADTIAGQLGIAPATVRVHLSRATAMLRHELSPSQIMEAER